MRGAARPLEGVPLGVKDLEDAEGLVTSQGRGRSVIRLAKRDSTQVQRLRALGPSCREDECAGVRYTAITKNLVYGVTRSPWDLERTPGGSSGGSAAAMAANVLPLVTASDGGGSIRIPASFTGTFGLKTSYGRGAARPFRVLGLRRYVGVRPAHQGPSRTARCFSTKSPGRRPAIRTAYRIRASRTSAAVRSPLPKLRIGYSPDLGYAAVQSDIAAAVEEAVKAFDALATASSASRMGRRSSAVTGRCSARSRWPRHLHGAPAASTSRSSGVVSSPA